MDKLETIMDGRPALVRSAMIEYLIRHFCPREFDLSDCDSFCHDGGSSICAKCWEDALDED